MSNASDSRSAPLATVVRLIESGPRAIPQYIRRVDLLYYLRVGTDVIQRYQNQIAPNSMTPERVQSLQRQSVMQEQRLEMINAALRAGTR